MNSGKYMVKYFTLNKSAITTVLYFVIVKRRLVMEEYSEQYIGLHYDIKDNNNQEGRRGHNRQYIYIYIYMV